MIGVMLSAIKILGIVLLVIIGLALLIILMVLFIPIRYKGKIYFKKVPDINLNVSWFFKFLNVNIIYKDRLDIIGKIGWFFKVYSNKDEEDKDTKKEEHLVSEIIQEPIAGKETITVEKTDNNTIIIDNHNKAEDNKQIEELDSQEKRKSKQKKTKEKKMPNEQSKINKIVEKIKDIHYLLTYEENKKVLLMMLEKLRKLLVHILPKKIVGYFKFGFEDPATTGQVLEGLAIFYPLYKDNFKIVPMFYDEIIEVDISFKGKLRVFYAAYVALILWLNKKKIKTRPR